MKNVPNERTRWWWLQQNKYPQRQQQAVTTKYENKQHHFIGDRYGYNCEEDADDSNITNTLLMDTYLYVLCATRHEPRRSTQITEQPVLMMIHWWWSMGSIRIPTNYISHTKSDRRRKENIDLFEWPIHATMRVQPIRRVVLNIKRSIGSPVQSIS